MRATHRPALIKGDYAYLPIGKLAKDGYAIVDKEFAYLDQYYWHLHHSGYAQNGQCKRLHAFILPKHTGLVTDHISGDKRDNRKSNLRRCTQAQNMANMKPYLVSQVPYKGVWKHKNRYRSALRWKGKRFELGLFDTPEEAAKAFDIKAKEIHGEYAWTNFRVAT